MDYNEKKKFVGKIAYIILSIMTVTILCITIYTFIGSFRRGDTKDIPAETNATSETNSYDTQKGIEITDPPHAETEKKPSAPSKDNETLDPSKEANAEIKDDEKPSLPANNSFTMPAEGIVSKKHDLDCAVYSLTMGDYRIHSGIDIEAEVGSTVSACAYGTIKSIYTDPFEGKCIVIDHENGVMSYYKNLSENIADGIKEGSTVNQGQAIGTIGESAQIEIADSPHLHFEITVNSKKVDPLQYLPISASVEAEAPTSAPEE